MIAGWDLTPGNIVTDNAAGSVRLSSTAQALTIWTGSINEAEPKLVLGKLPLNDGTVNEPYGFAVFSGAGTVSGSEASASVLITANKARLAGWELIPGRLSSGTVADINGNNASIALGTGATTATGTPTDGLFFVSASASPVFYVGSTFSYVDDVLKAGGWEIGNGQISSSLGTAQIISNNGGAFALGSTPPTNYETGTGVFLSGSGQALFGDAGGSRVQWTGTALRISSSAFNLTTAGNVTASNALFENVRILGGAADNSITPFTFAEPSFIGGGNGNTIEDSHNSFLGGGVSNRLNYASSSVIVGGENNAIKFSKYAFIAGGFQNGIGNERYGTQTDEVSGSNLSAILGGSFNQITGSHSSIIVGGFGNKIEADFSITWGKSTGSFIGGGNSNLINDGFNDSAGGGGNFSNSTIVGGTQNEIRANQSSFIGGGLGNSMYGPAEKFNTIGGGRLNSIRNFSTSSVIAGGETNVIQNSFRSAIAGGRGNEISSSFSSFIGGGESNDIFASPRSAILSGNQAQIIQSGNATVINGTGLISQSSGSVGAGSGTNF